MKIPLNAVAVTLALLLLTGCAAAVPAVPAPQPTAKADSEASVYHKLTAQAANEKIAAGGVTIVDVRTAAEYEEQHIADAVLIPNETIGEEKPELLPDTEAVLLVYCRSGRRSKEASDKLVALGYQHVYDFGGIIDWPYEMVNGVAPR